jgi:hypothetical protein
MGPSHLSPLKGFRDLDTLDGLDTGSGKCPLEKIMGEFPSRVSRVSEGRKRGIKEFLGPMLAHEKWKTGTSFLVDHSELNLGHLTVAEVRDIADVSVRPRAELGRARCATVAPRNVQYGLVRMWEVFVEGRWDVIHQAFRSRDEAVSWLMNDRRKGQESPGPAAY